MKPTIGIITQARMTSTRLPGKVFKEINHKSLLQYHIERLKKTGFEIVIATTTNESDNLIYNFAEEKHIKNFRGSEHNVLSRFYETAKKFSFDIVIRVTSDCPLIDPHLIRNGVEKYLQLNNVNLYLSNVKIRTFARGFDFEVFSFNLLENAYLNTTDETDLEHVTPYIYNNKSNCVEFYNLKQPEDNSKYRVTVDTEADFELIKQLIEKYSADQLSHYEIETLLSKHAELVSLNNHIQQKKT